VNGSCLPNCYTRRMKSRYLFRFILILFAIATVANAQIQFHFGVEAGVPLTDTLSSTSASSTSPFGSSIDRYNSETKRLLIGPAVRVDLQRGLGIEFDALYQRVNYDHATVISTPPIFNQSFEQTTANRWQFPLLVQYHWTLSNTKSNTKLFAELGPSISRIANGQSTISSRLSTGSSTSSSTRSTTGQGGTWAGITMGAGVDLPFFHRHLRPEFRYSHWFSPGAGSAVYAGLATPTAVILTGDFIASTPVAFPAFRTTQNEAAFLLGLTF
jgi:hypothetical protein